MDTKFFLGNAVVMPAEQAYAITTDLKRSGDFWDQREDKHYGLEVTFVSGPIQISRKVHLATKAGYGRPGTIRGTMFRAIDEDQRFTEEVRRQLGAWMAKKFQAGKLDSREIVDKLWQLMNCDSLARPRARILE